MTTLQQLQELGRTKLEAEYEASGFTMSGMQEVLDAIIASTIEEVRKAVVPEPKEIPLQQYDYDEIPDEKLTEININRQLFGENLAAIEIRRRFTELTSEQKGI